MIGGDSNQRKRIRVGAGRAIFRASEKLKGGNGHESVRKDFGTEEWQKERLQEMRPFRQLTGGKRVFEKWG